MNEEERIKRGFQGGDPVGFVAAAVKTLVRDDVEVILTGVGSGTPSVTSVRLVNGLAGGREE